MQFQIPAELDAELSKRFHLPGFKLEKPCPVCNKQATWSGDEYYIDYPAIGKPSVIFMHCDECTHEWEEKITIQIIVEY